MNDLILRSSIAIGIIAAALLGYWLVSRYMVSRVQGKRLGLENLESGIPAILYFTSPSCVPCRTVQRPELVRLATWLGEHYQLVQIDCTEQPELAEYWGVLSVPTTFIIDSHGQPRHINHGVTRADVLLEQLEKVEQRSYLVKKQEFKNVKRKTQLSS